MQLLSYEKKIFPEIGFLCIVFALLLVFGFTQILKPWPSGQLAVAEAEIKLKTQIVAGKDVQWTAKIKKSQIADGRNLAKLPKSAGSIAISETEPSLASDFSSELALESRQEFSKFASASLLGSVKGFLGSFSGAVKTIVNFFDFRLAQAGKITYFDLEKASLGDGDFVFLTFSTPGPSIKEKKTATGKTITVKGPDDPIIEYADVLAYANVPEIFGIENKNKIKIQWQGNEDRDIQLNTFDLNGNGKIDYVEWTVPHLSEQTFEIIFISKAFELDKNKEVLKDIYDIVKAKDNQWATVAKNHYVRVTFEQVLDNTKDITVYAKPTNPGTTPTIEVYIENGTELITTFPTINHEDTYKIYLTDLKEPTDTFDLKIVDGDIDFDYIVDPSDVVLDDTTFNDLESGYSPTMRGMWGPYWKSTKIAYIIYLDADNSIVYRKTTDSGATWSEPVTISSDTPESLSVWYDKHTPGDTGTKLHVAWLDDDDKNIGYRSLDVSNDSLGTETLVATSYYGDSVPQISITKARGGNLYIHWVMSYSQDNSQGFHRSTDGGDNWTSRTEDFENSNLDYSMLFPGNESDNQDIWMVYWDGSADTISLKVYDNSGDSWSETTISTGMEDYTGGEFGANEFSGAVRASDNHLILAARNDYYGDAAPDLMVWDIGGTGSITAKTNVLTDLRYAAHAEVFIDQNTNDIYVSYIHSDGPTNIDIVNIYYKKSADGGASWGSETQMSANTADTFRMPKSGHSVGDSGGYYMIAWVEINDDDILLNASNAVAIIVPAGVKIDSGVNFSSGIQLTK